MGGSAARVGCEGRRQEVKTFRAATFNIGSGSDDRKIADLEHLADDYDVTVLGCQEASDRRKALRRFVKRNPSWRVYQPRTPGGAAVPILWDGDEWRRLRFRSVLAVARTWVGAVGAGPTFAKPKQITIVVLRHRPTGRVVKFVNSHLIPSATRKSLPRDEEKARLAHYLRHVAALVRIVGRSQIPVVLTMDSNATPDFGPLKPLHNVGLNSWSRVGTHGKRAIDDVLHRDLNETASKNVPTSSDHDAVVKTLAHR